MTIEQKHVFLNAGGLSEGHVWELGLKFCKGYLNLSRDRLFCLFSWYFFCVSGNVIE